MSLSLVIHRFDGAPDGAAGALRTALRESVWEVAETHWALDDATILVASDLSAEYLLDHFRRALARRGLAEPGLLLVAAVGPTLACAGVPADSEAWLRQALA